MTSSIWTPDLFWETRKLTQAREDHLTAFDDLTPTIAEVQTEVFFAVAPYLTERR